MGCRRGVPWATKAKRDEWRTYQDVGSDLSERLGLGERIKDVILNLEVLPHRNENRECELVRRLVRDAGLGESSG